MPKRARGFCRWAIALAALLPGIVAGAAAPPAKTSAAPPSQAPAKAADPLASLRFRFIGPHGNRVIAVAGVPGDPRPSMPGAASGGIWKTTDGGTTWGPICDSQQVQSIGSLAVAPSDPQRRLGRHRRDVHPQQHLHRRRHLPVHRRRTDLDPHGARARPAGSAASRSTHATPTSCSPRRSATAYGPQQERGVFRTTDGGKTWERVLFVNDNTGGARPRDGPVQPEHPVRGDVAADIHPWAREWRDGQRHLGVARRRRRPGRSSTGARPPDAATAGQDRPWRCRAARPQPRLRPDRDERPRLSTAPPTAASLDVRQPGHDLLRAARATTRASLVAPGRREPDLLGRRQLHHVARRRHHQGPSAARRGGDCHDMWIDPVDPGPDDPRLRRRHPPSRWTAGRSWRRRAPPGGADVPRDADNEVPYHVYGNMQDGYSHGARATPGATRIHRGLWTSTAGCESGWAVPDTVDHNMVWSGCYDAGLEAVRRAHADGARGRGLARAHDGRPAGR